MDYEFYVPYLVEHGSLLASLTLFVVPVLFPLIIASPFILGLYIWKWGRVRNPFLSFLLSACVVLSVIAVAVGLSVIAGIAYIAAVGYAAGILAVFLVPLLFPLFLVILGAAVPTLRYKRLRKSESSSQSA